MLKKISGRLLRLLTFEKETEAAERPRMLIVDGEESICFSMSEYFSLHGYLVDTARELDEAERHLQNTKYAVAILDLRLGAGKDTDGLQVIKLLHQSRPETRVVILTAYGSAELEDKARHHGADAFLRKPKPLSQVAQIVEGLIESRAGPMEG